MENVKSQKNPSPVNSSSKENNKAAYAKYLEEQKQKKKQYKKMLKAKKIREKRETLAYEQDRDEKSKNDPEKKNKFRRLFFGVGKEFWRVSWPKKREMLNNFITVVIITLILAGILTGITYLITAYVN